MKIINIISLLALAVFLSGCKFADVRTDYMQENEGPVAQEQKGKALLQESIMAMGYNQFENIDTYEANVFIKWKFPWSIMPLNSLPGSKRNKVKFRFRPDSFDGQIEYMEGRKKGDIHGIQSWQDYNIKDSKTAVLKKDVRRNWGLAAYHYMLEGPFRLQKAGIIRYAGEKEFEGKMYDMVFASWQTTEPHKEHDQWLLYINRETKFVDMAHLTIRDFFAPFPRNLAGGTVRFLNRTKTSKGIYMPDELVIQLMAPKKETKYVYSVSLSDYQFDSFPLEKILPFPDMRDYGDSKPAKTEDKKH